jgi:hypothetical protein
MEVLCTYRVMSVGCTRIKVELMSVRVEEGLISYYQILKISDLFFSLYKIVLNMKFIF